MDKRGGVHREDQAIQHQVMKEVIEEALRVIPRGEKCERPHLSWKPSHHGTLSRAEKGCNCEFCQRAYSVYRQARKQWEY